MTRWLSFLFLAAAVVAAPLVSAAQRPRDRLAGLFFAPELVMSNQEEIGLTPAQRDAFVREMQSTQSDLVPLQLDLRAAKSALSALLERPRVDEEAALAAAERVLELEQQVKKRHMVLLIRIKNLLTEEQQRHLRRLRAGGR